VGVALVSVFVGEEKNWGRGTKRLSGSVHTSTSEEREGWESGLNRHRNGRKGKKGKERVLLGEKGSKTGVDDLRLVEGKNRMKREKTKGQSTPSFEPITRAEKERVGAER